MYDISEYATWIALFLFGLGLGNLLLFGVCIREFKASGLAGRIVFGAVGLSTGVVGTFLVLAGVVAVLAS